MQSYRAAVGLNPYQARYWFDLAGAYQLLGDTDAQKAALERGLVADPTTPDLAWEAGNFYLVQGDTDKALREFRVVMESDPYLPPAAVKLCWRVKPDIEVLLRDAVPPTAVYATFPGLPDPQKETAAAAKVWTNLAQLHQPLPPPVIFAYIRYLVGQHEVDQARLVWQQAATLSGLSAYQPSPENLIVNGDFNLNVLNGGFDWQYRQSKEVSLALDPTQSHGGHRSLLITFDAQKIDDAGIAQVVPVQPSTGYDFSAYFKADDIQGAGGPRFALQDLYTETTYFASDELKNADFWKEVSGSFTTGPDTKLLLLRIRRANLPECRLRANCGLIQSVWWGKNNHEKKNRIHDASRPRSRSRSDRPRRRRRRSTGARYNARPCHLLRGVWLIAVRAPGLWRG